MWQLLALTSAVFSALAAVLEKKVLIKSDPLWFSFILSVCTFVVCSPLLFFVPMASISADALLVLYLKSVLGAIAFLMVMYGIKHNEISNSLPLLVLTPGVVAVAAFFLLGEDIGIKGVGGMVLLLTGTYFLQLEKGAHWLSPMRFMQRNRAQYYILIAIVLFSVTSILDKTILKSYKLPPEAFLPIQQLFFTLNFLLIGLFRKEKKPTILLRQLTKNWMLILILAFTAVIYRYSHILAIKGGSVALVLSIKRTSVFFAAAIGGRYFREQHLMRRSVAIVVMIVGAVIIILS